MRCFKVLSLAATAALATVSMAVQIVAPNQYAAAPGPTSQWRPFGWTPDTLRIQQVFLASQFGGVSGKVSKIAYRIDEVTGHAFGPSVADLRIALSHTTRGPHGLGFLFSNNPGPDNTVVWNGVMTLSSTGAGFDIVFDVNDVFTYNGTSNLMLDMWVLTGTPNGFSDLDATEEGNQVTSLVWGWGGGDNATNLGSAGIITQFTIVPEPATLAALGLGLLPFLRRRR